MLRSLLLKAADSEWLAEQATRWNFSRRAVKRFMPGEDAEAAYQAAAALAPDGLGAVLTQLGENLSSHTDALAVRDHYVGVFATIRERKLPAWVSIKPTQLGLDFSQSECQAHLEVLAEHAKTAGSSLWIDMEDSRYVDRTLDLYRELRQRHERIGLCLQAYLYRTPGDLESLWPLKPWIRLVKGAYAEPMSVAYPAKRSTDLAYYDLAVKLLEAAVRGDALAVFGTHDLLLIDRIVAAAKERNAGRQHFEFHMLYGIRSADQLALVRQGHGVRTLISYGQAWYKWYMRRLAERPSNMWFVMKSLLTR